MERDDLLYCEPENVCDSVEKAPVSNRQAIKAMVFGFVALTLAYIPYLGILSAPVFAIISLCMVRDFKQKHPDQARGFLKAGKICAILSLPLCVIESLIYTLNIFYYL